MKTFIVIRVVVVFVVTVCTVLLLPDTWYAVQDARRLVRVVRGWQASGPHVTFLGQARERLAAAGWIASPRDPLVECGIPADGGWTKALLLLLSAERYLACMEEEVQLAQEEHLTFRANFLLAVACILLTVMAVMLQGLAWRPHQQQPFEEVVYATQTSQGVPFPPAAVTEKNERPPAGSAEPQEVEAGHVRRSLHVPPKYRERLAGPGECFLEYLRLHHSVLIFMDPARKRMHIKGRKKHVMECYGAVKALLAEWLSRQAAGG